MTVKTDQFQVGLSGTPTNNFVVDTDLAGNLRIGRGNVGSVTNLLSMDNTTLTFPSGGLSAINFVSGVTLKANGSAAWVMTAAGEITKPLQPAFSAHCAAANSNVTGDGTTYTIICDNEIFDQNSDYNLATGVFTAPVTGRYFLNVDIYYTGLAAGNTTSQVLVTTSNRTYYGFGGNIGALRDPSNNVVVAGPGHICDMDAGDTATFTGMVSGGTKVVSQGGSAVTRVSGFLAC